MTDTIQLAWAWAMAELAPTSPTPKLDARLLLQHLLQVEHTYLIGHGDDSLSPEQVQQYQALIAQAKQKVPIPYLTEQAPFYGLTFYVNPHVLIPRPETELLVERAVEWIQAQAEPPHLVDIGTGSGCIPITLARQCKEARVTAVDISLPALAVAQKNARTLTPNRIHFYAGHLLEPVAGQKIDLITANLPYVTQNEWTELDDGVKLHEPKLALVGGVDGLDLIGELLKQAVPVLQTTGAILLEIGWKQGEKTVALAQQFFPQKRVRLWQDWAGHDRLVMVD